MIDFSMVQGRNIIDDPLEKKLHQLIISRLDGDNITNPYYRDGIFRLVQNGIGGFILFGGSKDEVRDFIATLQTMAALPLFIASDIERGVGQQVHGSTFFPCQMAIAAAIDRSAPRDVGALEETIHAIAVEATHIGINMPMIPVLDVNRDPDNPIICTRAFSDDTEVVTWFGLRYIEVLEKASLLSCAKHFPGHGDTSVDSHIALPVIRKSYEELLNTDIKPFSAAIRQGVSSIMIGHLSVPSVDTVPASLSQEIHAILRNALGFKGLILTDALTMHALNDIRDVPVRCLNAGVDILLHPADPEETVNTLLSAVLSGQLSENRIDTSLDRIMKRKEALRNTVIKDVDYQSHAILSSQIAHKSVSLIRCTPGLAPLVQGENIHIFMTGDQEPALRSPLRSLSPNVWILHENPDYQDLHASMVIIAIYTSIAAWKENAAINRDEQQRIRNIISRSRKSVVISFGNPYVLRHFPEAGALIAAYEGTDQVQQTVVKWLRGLVRLEGKIPVSLS